MMSKFPSNCSDHQRLQKAWKGEVTPKHVHTKYNDLLSPAALFVQLRRFRVAEVSGGQVYLNRKYSSDIKLWRDIAVDFYFVF